LYLLLGNVKFKLLVIKKIIKWGGINFNEEGGGENLVCLMESNFFLKNEFWKSELFSDIW
jgi:hypothetical protein